jgi:hypothetical protein
MEKTQKFTAEPMHSNIKLNTSQIPIYIIFSIKNLLTVISCSDYYVCVGIELYPVTASVTLPIEFKSVWANIGLFLANNASTIINIADAVRTMHTVFTIGSISAILFSYVHALINN